MIRLFARCVLAFVCLCGPVGARTLPPNPTSMRITADLTEVARRLYHAEIDIPVRPGPAAFTSPLWLPGSHFANGPIGTIVGIVFTANGSTLAWTRDDVATSEYRVVIPQGASTVHVHLDAIVARGATRNTAMLEWDSLLLYPASVPVDAIPVEASVTVPAGWGSGTALTPIGARPTPPVTGIDERLHAPPADAATTAYAPTTIRQLEDSPVLAGRYFREYAPAPTVVPRHFLDVAADDAKAATIRPAVRASMTRLVHEAWTVYGSHHYDAYHFLVTLSDYAGGDGGLEHAQSTDLILGRSALTDDAHQDAVADLIAHEFTHSWNGKYRLPTGLARPDFATPVATDMLWVYEGMTQYLGDVLATRVGLKAPEAFREMLALTAADLDAEPGRRWRSTADTARAVALVRGGSSWSNWRRGKDYYGDGELLWLDIDTLIRERTHGRASLDDFEKRFLGAGGTTGPIVRTYDLGEIVADLDAIAPYDWKRFFADNVYAIRSRADVDGIVRGGYRLVYDEQPTAAETAVGDPANPLYVGSDFWYSLGLRVDDDGTVDDVRYGGPADAANVAPHERITAVGDAPYTAAVLRAAVHAASGEPIRLTVRQDGETFVIAISYRGGERYPRLVQQRKTPVLLDAIVQPSYR